MKPLLIGESNPYGADPRFALYPRPANCAGERLCRAVFGLREATYLDMFERVNLLEEARWSAPRARAAAVRIEGDKANTDRTIVLCGAKVSAAFGLSGWEAPYRLVRAAFPLRWMSVPLVGQYVLLPHPSGLCRRWHEPGIVERCRDLLREALPSVPFGETDASKEPMP